VSQAFPPLGPEFEPFLYAILGDEQNGMPLTIISALARSGVDPWREAARIARLPKESALEMLARMIPDRSGDEAADFASSLISLLPAARPSLNSPLPGPAGGVPRWSPLIPGLLALLIGLAVFALFRTAPPTTGQDQKPPPPVADKADP